MRRVRAQDGAILALGAILCGILAAGGHVVVAGFPGLRDGAPVERAP